MRDRRISLGVASSTEFFRAKTLETKEPETLDWIDQQIRPGEVLYDIGANVGQFALYAALGGVRVLAFEPESQNFARLNENIVANGVGDLVTAYPVGLSDDTVLERIYLSRFEKGAALHNIGGAVDESGRAFAPSHTQGVVTVPLDHLHERYGLPFPNHLKIDVDGFEGRVLAGAERTLRDPRLRSVLIEVGATGRSLAVSDAVREAGLRQIAEYPTTNVIFAR